jgi:DNA polymerase III epsilon subunit
MDLTKNIDDCLLVFLDLETTGLNVLRGEAICEIGGVKVRGKATLETFHALVHPKKNMPDEVYKIHGISDEDVKHAPFFEAIADDLLRFLSGSVVCAYNAKFDIDFLNEELQRIQYPIVTLPVVDVMAMAKKTLVLRKYSLEAILSFLQIERQNAHRAMDDARAALDVFLTLTETLALKDIRMLGDFISLYGIENEFSRAQAAAKMALLEEAIQQKRAVHIRYRNRNNDTRREQVAPIHVLPSERDTLLLFHDAHHGQFSLSLRDILAVEP